MPVGDLRFGILLFRGEDCGYSLFETNSVTLEEGNSYTLVFFNEFSGSSPFGVGAYPDVPLPGPTTANVRFIHAATGKPNVDVGDQDEEIDDEPLLLWSDVAPRESTDPVSIGEGPEVELPVQRTIRVYESGTTSELYAVEDFELNGGTTTTLFLLEDTDTISWPPYVWACVDSAEGTECSPH